MCACSAGHSWTVASQALLSMEFYMQEYWGGLLFPTPGYLPNPGIKTVWLVSPALAGRFLPLCHLGCEENTSAHVSKICVKKSAPRDLEGRYIKKKISFRIFVRQDAVSKSSGSSSVHMYFKVNIKPIP